MDDIKKMVFVNTDNKINKVVIFRENQEPLVEDFSEKHLEYILNKMKKDNYDVFEDDYIEFLKETGFLGTVDSKNKEQISKLQEEINEEKKRYESRTKNQDTSLDNSDMSKTNNKKTDDDLFLEMGDLLGYLNVCSLRENNQLDKYNKELLELFLKTQNESIHAVEKAYNDFINASESERESKRNHYIEIRDNALEKVNEYKRKRNIEESDIQFKEKSSISETNKEDVDYSKYSDGKLRTDFYDQPGVDLYKIAEQYSEGDKMLQDILVALWNNGIRTTACCRGHKEEGHSSRPYIQLIKDEKSESFIKATIDYMLLYGGLELEFKNYGKDYDELIIDMGSEEEKQKYFKFVNYYLINKSEYEEIDNNRMKYANGLLKTAKENGLNCSFLLTKDEMGFGFSKPGYGIMYTNNMRNLDDKGSIDFVKECVNSFKFIPCETFECSEKSLEEFLRIVNPSLFDNKHR